MAISAEQVKALRDQTGAGMMECKKALVDADGELEKAVTLLRERGLAAAARTGIASSSTLIITARSCWISAAAVARAPMPAWWTTPRGIWWPTWNDCASNWASKAGWSSAAPGAPPWPWPMPNATLNM